MSEWLKTLTRVWLFVTPWTVAHQAPLSMGSSRQEYWSGLPLPSPGDLPNRGIEPRSPTLQADALTPAPPGKVTNGKFSSYVWVVFHFVCLYTTSSLSNHLCLEVLRRVILLLIVVLSCVLRIFFTCILVTLNRENLLFWAHWYCLISCENDSDTLPNTSTEGILSLLPLVEGNSFLTLSFWFFIS